MDGVYDMPVSRRTMGELSNQPRRHYAGADHSVTTTEWYVDWLKENYPDWSDDQRLEVATGFANQQLPPVRPIEEAEEETEVLTDERAKRRKDERMLRGYIGNLLDEAEHGKPAEVETKAKRSLREL